MGKYEDSPVWEDIVPIPQDDGSLHPLAAINYTEDYSEAMAYLRAVMAKDEHSDRTLELTQDIVRMNPAHYTVWLYRAESLLKLNKDPVVELVWLSEISAKHLKNYQIWHHRQTIMSRVSSLPPTEVPFLDVMFSKDPKNYHVWSYRQWLVRRFALWDAELDVVERMIEDDVRNNSAWNHRWFITFARHSDPEKSTINDVLAGEGIAKPIFAREISYAMTKITSAPQNQSSWNYLRGVAKTKGDGLQELQLFAEQFANLDADGSVQSTYALDLLADLYAEKNDKQSSGKALALLATKYDPVRKSYWNYRRGLLGLPEVTV